MATFLLRACALFTLIFGVSFGAAAQESSTLVISLNSDDVRASDAAFDLARLMQQNGQDVVVYLNLDAVRLGSSKTPQPVGPVSQKTGPQQIADILAADGKVFACTVCITQAGLSMRDRVEGVALGSQHFRQILMAPGTRVINF